MRNFCKHNIKSMALFDKFDKTIFLRVQFAKASTNRQASENTIVKSMKVGQFDRTILITAWAKVKTGWWKTCLKDFLKFDFRSSEHTEQTTFFKPTQGLAVYGCGFHLIKKMWGKQKGQSSSTRTIIVNCRFCNEPCQLINRHSSHNDWI